MIVLVDALQVEVGASATVYSPQSGWKLRLARRLITTRFLLRHQTSANEVVERRSSNEKQCLL